MYNTTSFWRAALPSSHTFTELKIFLLELLIGPHYSFQPSDWPPGKCPRIFFTQFVYTPNINQQR